MSSDAAVPPDKPPSSGEFSPSSQPDVESDVGSDVGSDIESDFESDIELSIIAPAHNEEENISGMVDDVAKAMGGQGIRFEMIFVNDGSTDETASIMAREAAAHNWLTCYAMANTPPGSGNGQSAAFHAGVRLARGATIALLDADRQNDPGDLPAMLKAMAEESADMVQGDRSANRKDSPLRRATSWVGRSFRQVLLGDSIRDTGCSLRVFRREIGLALPLQYKGMHRFIPFYARNLGYKVIEFPVHHRPRTAGEAKYGVWNRALPGLGDLFAVRWMRKRLRDTATLPIEPSEGPS